MRVVYYLEVLSSWCHWAEPAWDELRARFGGQVEFEWRIALMSAADFPATREQCDWYYRRSGVVTRSPYRLDSGWLEPERQGDYRAPNLVAEAGKSLGITDDRVRRALTEAALRRGRKIGDVGEAAAVAAEASGVAASRWAELAEDPAVIARVAASTEEFHHLRVTQRPAFLLQNGIGDRAVVSGLWRAEPLAAVIEAMLDDAAAYRSHAAHHGLPPAA